MEMPTSRVPTHRPKKTAKQMTTSQRTDKRPALARITNTSKIPASKKSHAAKANPRGQTTTTTRVVAKQREDVISKQRREQQGRVKGLKGQDNETVVKVCLPEPVLLETQDADDPFACTAYVADIHTNLRAQETQQCYTITDTFLHHQSEVKSWHRAVLLDWLVQVQERFHLLPETLYLTVDTLDRYLQAVDVSRSCLQLVGVASLLIAAKYEEIYPPSIRDMEYIAADTYPSSEIRDMERIILKTLDYRLGKPAPITFLRHYSKVAETTVKEHNLAKYILELALLDTTLSAVPPSCRAAAALHLSRTLLSPYKIKNRQWTPVLAYHSGYEVADLEETVTQLQSALTFGHMSKRTAAIRGKYSHSTFQRISQLPLLKDL